MKKKSPNFYVVLSALTVFVIWAVCSFLTLFTTPDAW